MDKVSFFSADFRDGRVHIGGKAYPAGTFATHLLNQYYVNDTAARLSVFIQSNWRVAETLSIGFLDPDDYMKAGEEIQQILKTLPKLQPFSMLQIDDERNRTAELFADENGKQISEYFHRRAKVELTDDNEAALNLLPKEYDKDFFKASEKLIADVSATLAFYDRIGNDVTDAFHRLRKFASRVDEAARLDEAHLLPIAFEVFGQQPFPIKAEYVPVRKTRNSKDFVTARRLYFESYYSFLKSFDVSVGTPFVVFKERHAEREVLDCIRNLRTGYTAQSLAEYNKLRKVMAIWDKYERRYTAETIEKIAAEAEETVSNVKEILLGGLRNENAAEFYRRYSDDDGDGYDDSGEEYIQDSSSDTEYLYFKAELYYRLMNAYEDLNYEERTMLAERCGFCTNCYGVFFMDGTEVDPKKKPIPQMMYTDIATNHGYSSANTAKRICDKALEKLRKAVIEWI